MEFPYNKTETEARAGAAQSQFDGYKMEVLAAVVRGTPLPPNQTPK